MQDKTNPILGWGFPHETETLQEGAEENGTLIKH